jgi:hypothetical protein
LDVESRLKESELNGETIGRFLQDRALVALGIEDSDLHGMRRVKA